MTDQPPILSEATMIALLRRIELLEHLMLQNASTEVTLARVLNAMIDKMGLALVGFNRDKCKQDLKEVWTFWRRVRAAGEAELPPGQVGLGDVDTEGSA